MAVYAQNHFHLYAETATFDPAALMYGMAFQGHQFKSEPAVKAQRGLTGKLIINRLFSSGAVVKFRDAGFIIVATRDEMNAIELLNGVNCYYIPNWHEEGVAHDASDAYKVLPVIVGKQMLDPGEKYWMLTIQLQENTL